MVVGGGEKIEGKQMEEWMRLEREGIDRTEGGRSREKLKDGGSISSSSVMSSDFMKPNLQ